MDKNPHMIVLRPKRALTVKELEAFWPSLNEAIGQHACREILIDLKEIEFIDSAAAALLSRGTLLAESQSKRLGCCNANSQVQMLLEVTQMDQSIRIYENAADFIEVPLGLMAA